MEGCLLYTSPSASVCPPGGGDRKVLVWNRRDKGQILFVQNQQRRQKPGSIYISFGKGRKPDPSVRLPDG